MSTRSHQQKVSTVVWIDHKYFYQVFKAIQVIPLAQGFLPIYTWIGKFYQREQWSWCSILSGKDPKFMIYKILTIWWFMKFYNWCSPFSINVVIQYLLQYVEICSIVSKNKINVQNTKESNKWPKILISWSYYTMHVDISSILFVPQVNTSKYLSMIKAQHVNHDIKRTTCRPVKKGSIPP